MLGRSDHGEIEFDPTIEYELRKFEKPNKGFKLGNDRERRSFVKSVGPLDPISREDHTAVKN